MKSFPFNSPLHAIDWLKLKYLYKFILPGNLNILYTCIIVRVKCIYTLYLIWSMNIATLKLLSPTISQTNALWKKINTHLKVAYVFKVHCHISLHFFCLENSSSDILQNLWQKMALTMRTCNVFYMYDFYHNICWRFDV